MCAKLQGNRNTHLCFIAIFKVCEKTKNKKIVKKKKNQEIKTKFWALISRKWLWQFSSNLVCGVAYLAGTSAANLVPIG